ncbi:MAG: hypothetical protein GF317_10840 [Candidatus Lokiarchaeota archaeon]|nr:hypothetical protein [Candidatus Lokiarchaeota archaeon]MBD3200158.1 hypothetical protein [Candidatus Lokiarchaeota archaeon]
MENNKRELEEIEKNLFRSLSEDGFYDIFFGLLYLNFGFSFYLRDILLVPYDFLFFPIFFGIDFFILFYGKRKITIPRIGFVQFREKRRNKLKKMRRFIIITVSMSIIIFLISLVVILPSETIEFHLGLITLDFCFIFIPITLMGYFLDYYRLYITGLIGGISLALAELSFMGLLYVIIGVVAFLISGMIITTSGIIMLLKFIKKYNLENKIRGT